MGIWKDFNNRGHEWWTKIGGTLTKNMAISSTGNVQLDNLQVLASGGNLNFKSSAGSNIGTLTNAGNFSVLGNISGNVNSAATPGLITDTATIPASSTLLQYICNKATAFTITLGTAVGFEGNILRFKNIGAGVVTIDGNASETIDGATTTTLSQYQAVSLIAYAGNWYVL